MATNPDVKVMQVFVDTMVGIPRFSYPARKNAPRPKNEEFAHISLLEEYQVGIPVQRLVAQDEATTTYQNDSMALLRFRIGIVETDGNISPKIMHGWTKDKIKQLMMSTGYGFVLCMPVSLEDAKLESEWEPRQGLSVEMYVNRTSTEVVNNIEELEVAGEFHSGTDVFPLNFNVNE